MPGSASVQSNASERSAANPLSADDHMLKLRGAEALGLPPAVRQVLEQLEVLMQRFDLAPPVRDELTSTIKGCTLLGEGAQSAEAALFAALLRASPGIHRLADWLSSAAIPGVPVPLHPAAFSLIGAAYFFAKLVKTDPAVCTRAIEAYSIDDRSPSVQRSAVADELEGRFLGLLRSLLSTPNCCVGELLKGEVEDRHSMTRTQLLAGVLLPLITEMSHSSRGVAPSFASRVFGLGSSGVPQHLRDLGLLGDMGPRHVLVVTELAEQYKQIAAGLGQEQAARAAREAAEVRMRAEHEAQAKAEAEAIEAREKSKVPEVRATESALERLLAPLQNAHLMNKADVSAVVRTVFETLVNAERGISDESLYLLIDRLPRTLAIKQKGVLDAAIRAASAMRRERLGHGVDRWSEGEQECVSIAALWTALERVSVVVHPEQFSGLQPKILNFINATNTSALFGRYPKEFMTELGRAFISLHEKQCRRLLPQQSARG